MSHLVFEAYRWADQKKESADDACVLVLLHSMQGGRMPEFEDRKEAGQAPLMKLRVSRVGGFSVTSRHESGKPRDAAG